MIRRRGDDLERNKQEWKKGYISSKRRLRESFGERGRSVEAGGRDLRLSKGTGVK